MKKNNNSVNDLKFIINKEKTPPLLKNGIIFINFKSDKLLIEWKCIFETHETEIAFRIKDKNKIIITTNIISNLHMNHFVEIYELFFYRLFFILKDPNFQLTEIYLPKLAEKINLLTNVFAKPNKVFKILTDRNYISKIFSKYPEVNLKKFIYTWGWIDEGPSNLIHYEENKVLIYDFFLNFEPIGVVKWKLSEVQTNSAIYSLLELTFQDLILYDEFNPLEAFNSFRIGWLLLLYKVKDFSEHNKFSLKIYTS